MLDKSAEIHVGRHVKRVYKDCLFLSRQSPVGQGLLIYKVSRLHTTTHHSR